MATGKCRSCGHTTEFTQEDIDDLANCKCGECGEYNFELVGQNNPYNNEDEEDEEEVTECQECGNEVPDEELIYFEEADANICKKCIDKYYPREKEIVEKVVEKIVEKPVIAEDLLKDMNLFQPETKTQFD